jgi:G3E family GTPase
VASVPVPVTLIAGFLGSGKTTLLNRILRGEHGRRVAVMVNDFGDVSIDAALVVDAAETTITLANGCICCSIRDDLIGSVRDLLRRDPPPEQLVVELSGIADPGSVLRSFQVMEKSWPLYVDGVIALVDSESFPDDEAAEHHLLAREQLVLADVVVLNKLDLASVERVATLRRKIAGWVPSARIVETERADVPLELLLGLDTSGRANEPSAPAPHVEHDGAHGFRSFTYRTQQMLSLSALRETSTELPPSVFRVKGFVFLDAKPEYKTVLQIVGRRARIDLGQRWGDEQPETVLVFVGAGAGFDEAQIRGRFDACRVGRSAGPRAALASALEWVRARWR